MLINQIKEQLEKKKKMKDRLKKAEGFRKEAIKRQIDKLLGFKDLS